MPAAEFLDTNILVYAYDAMIIAAAEQAACRRIWSEDLNPGQNYFSLTVENPFAE